MAQKSGPRIEDHHCGSNINRTVYLLQLRTDYLFFTQIPLYLAKRLQLLIQSMHLHKSFGEISHHTTSSIITEENLKPEHPLNKSLSIHSLRAARIAGIYAMFGMLWILFSDQLLLVLTKDVNTLAEIQTVKGWLFIGATATLLFFLIRQTLVRQSRDEVALLRSEQRFRTLLDRIPDLIWLKDTDGVYLSCNATFERFFGAKESEIIGKTDYDFVDKKLADFFRENDRRAMAAGHPSSNEEWITFSDTGERVLLLTTKTITFDTDGTVIGVLGIGRDITDIRSEQKERIRLEKQLNQAQKIESIGQLAGGVAHDFNNMLGVIIGQTDLALMKAEKGDHPQPVTKNLKEIRKAAKHSASLTRQLLTFARKQVITPKVLDLNATVSGMLKMLQRLIGENISLTWEPGPELWPVSIDPTQVDQILANLCVNGRDAIKGSGRITILTSNQPSRSINKKDQSPEAVALADYVLLSVSDSGKGIPPELQKRIFEPFFTTKGTGEGTGLGLATVYGAVRQNNGYIDFSSKAGEGTCFNIYLPRETTPILQDRPGEQEQSYVGTETILLVEDEEPVLNMTRSILTECGYTVFAVTTVGEALDLSAKHRAQIKLLITDVIMPDMNGKELAKRVRELCSGIKVLYISGYSSDIISTNGIVEPEINFLQKPISYRRLATKVRKILDNSS